jgi:hypothetical protein
MAESALHETLKHLYAQQLGGTVEQPVSGYIVDILTPAEVIEIQTGSFAHLRDKLADLLREHAVRLVYPIAVRKQILLYAADGSLLRSRKSPLQGKPALAGKELLHIHQAVCHPCFTFELVMVTLTEERCNDGFGSWRRGGVSIGNRLLESVVETLVFSDPSSYSLLLPSGLPERFTNKDIAREAGISAAAAAKLSWFLRKIGVLAERGRQGRSLEFDLERPQRGG